MTMYGYVALQYLINKQIFIVKYQLLKIVDFNIVWGELIRQRLVWCGSFIDQVIISLSVWNIIFC